MRPIDANALLEHIKDLPTWWADGGGVYGQAMKYPEGMFDVEDVVSSIENAPTLTQPNELLTWEELKKLKNSPVYIEVMGVNSYWALVRDINDSGVWLMTVDDIDDYGSHCLYGKTWIAYCRPPEGEEEEKHVIEITENL